MFYRVFGNGCPYSFCQNPCSLQVCVGKQNRKLLSAKSGAYVGFSYYTSEYICKGLQNQISNIMPIGVVDLLEMVYVHNQKGERFFVPLYLFKDKACVFKEKPSVWQTGEWIIISQFLKLSVFLLKLRKQPAYGKGCIHQVIPQMVKLILRLVSLQKLNS
jgi:hypothetical protein